LKHDAKSGLEAEYAFQLKAFRLPPPQREYVFAAELGRKWRLDFWWQEYKLGVELHGLIVMRGIRGEGIVRGGHGTVPGMIRDMDKNNAGIILGISVLTFTQSHVKSRAAIEMTMRALTIRGWQT
jgi:hypothetical protein